MTKPKILFVFDMEADQLPLWKDGLNKALALLKKDFQFPRGSFGSPFGINTQTSPQAYKKHWGYGYEYDAVVAWGAFGSRPHQFLQSRVPYQKDKKLNEKNILLLGGYAKAPTPDDGLDLIFYECEWAKAWLYHQYNVIGGARPQCIHGFGINTDIFFPVDSQPLLWDYLTVGSFSLWKRQEWISQKPGRKLAVGQVQKNNLHESMKIAANLMLDGVAISDSVPPEDLAWYYRMSDTLYIPANIIGGGERAILEGRACDCKIEVAPDNPKLEELMYSPIWDHRYYAKQLREGILQCIGQK